ncbi:Leucine zipper transcription factor-like protein 1 [Borealophlyctis nickersoniae]|nr:Leucine zipper transcription factor-like protein 1 [Borealophlyctis nickersoniae]
MNTLTPQHREQIISYLRFIRLKRAQSLQEVLLTFDETKERRLVETTYTADEVTDIIAEVEKTVKSIVEDELILHSHTNALLLQQYLSQADGWKMRLTSNIAELENRASLQAMAKFEEEQFSSKVKASRPKTVVVSGGSDETIESLRREVARLEIELKEAQQRKSAPSGTVDKVHSKPPQMTTSRLDSLPPLPDKAQAEQIIKAQVAKMILTEITKLQERVRSLEEDLNIRIDQSKPVQNLKKMLARKNEQVKDYRTRLARYDPSVMSEVGE